jgi:hypothetical protein
MRPSKPIEKLQGFTVMPKAGYTYKLEKVQLGNPQHMGCHYQKLNKSASKDTNQDRQRTC